MNSVVVHDFAKITYIYYIIVLEKMLHYMLVLKASSLSTQKNPCMFAQGVHIVQSDLATS